MPESKMKIEVPIRITTHEVQNYPDTLLLEISKSDWQRLLVEIKRYPSLFRLFGDPSHKYQKVK